jgi:hypothetical protein
LKIDPDFPINPLKAMIDKTKAAARMLPGSAIAFVIVQIGPIGVSMLSERRSEPSPIRAFAD